MKDINPIAYDKWRKQPPHTPTLEELLEEEMKEASRADWRYDQDKHER